jgi:hypothetical protein
VAPIRKLTLWNEMENSELLECLAKIDKYLQDEDSVVKLLYLLPTYRSGLSIFAEGMFSTQPDISSLCSRILKKIKKCEVGNLAVKLNLTTFHQLKLSEF